MFNVVGLFHGLFAIKKDIFPRRPTRRICYYTVTCQNDRRHSSKIPIFNDFVAVLQADRTSKFQVLCSNPLLADFKLQLLSVRLNDRTTCGMI